MKLSQPTTHSGRTHAAPVTEGGEARLRLLFARRHLVEGLRIECQALGLTCRVCRNHLLGCDGVDC
jgi:hypothetical protein